MTPKAHGNMHSLYYYLLELRDNDTNTTQRVLKVCYSKRNIHSFATTIVFVQGENWTEKEM